MVRSSRRTLFLVVFILITCGFLGMVFGQKITPAAAPGGDSDMRESVHQFTTVYDVVEQTFSAIPVVQAEPNDLRFQPRHGNSQPHDGTQGQKTQRRGNGYVQAHIPAQRGAPFPARAHLKTDFSNTQL